MGEAFDTVNRPAHYNYAQIEPINVMIAWRIGYYTCLGNAIKYIARHRHKDTPVQDLKKAAWYVQKARQIVRGEAPEDYYTSSEAARDWALPPEMSRALSSIERSIASNPNRAEELEKVCKSLEKQIKKLTD